MGKFWDGDCNFNFYPVVFAFTKILGYLECFQTLVRAVNAASKIIALGFILGPSEELLDLSNITLEFFWEILTMNIGTLQVWVMYWAVCPTLLACSLKKISFVMVKIAYWLPFLPKLPRKM